MEYHTGEREDDQTNDWKLSDHINGGVSTRDRKTRFYNDNPTTYKSDRNQDGDFFFKEVRLQQAGICRMVFEVEYNTARGPKTLRKSFPFILKPGEVSAIQSLSVTVSMGTPSSHFAELSVTDEGKNVVRPSTWHPLTDSSDAFGIDFFSEIEEARVSGVVKTNEQFQKEHPEEVHELPEDAFGLCKIHCLPSD